MVMGQNAWLKNGPGTRWISMSSQGWVTSSLCTTHFCSPGETPLPPVADCIDQSENKGDVGQIDFAGSRDAGLSRALSFSRAFNETAAILSTIQAEPSP